MKAKKLKNIKYRKLLYKTEIDNIINTALIKNKILSPHYKHNYLSLKNDQSVQNQVKQEQGINIGISKIRNICNITGRSRALIKDYRLSRIKFKELAEAGQIPGVKKY